MDGFREAEGRTEEAGLQLGHQGGACAVTLGETRGPGPAGTLPEAVGWGPAGWQRRAEAR